MFDVIIIGAGIAGAACARELSRYDISILLLEAGSDVATGATRANSGIVHAGFDPTPGTLKARFNIEGSMLYPKLAEELDFPYIRNGSLVVAFAEEERPALETLLERGRENGVPELRIIESDELHELEPNLSENAIAALYAPSGAITNPYLACLALAENAVQNGVECRLDTRVTGIERIGDAWRVSAGDEAFDGRIVVDAAGTHSAEVASMAGDTSFEIVPRAGEYVLLDRSYGNTFTSTMFQVPTAKGKGVLVAPTTGGNLIVGPDAVVREDLDDTSTNAAGLNAVIDAAKKTWPAFSWRGVITNFAGVRSSCVGYSDFVLGEPEGMEGFFRIGGFDSPGLTAAPAVAVEYAPIIAERLNAKPNPTFDPKRSATPMFSRSSEGERATLIAQDSSWGHIICRCEEVAEAEIVAAIHSPIPATTIDAIKWRTRAGMGRCQSGFCMPLVAEIIARETGCDACEVRKSSGSSKIAAGRRGCFEDLPPVVFFKGGQNE